MLRLVGVKRWKFVEYVVASFVQSWIYISLPGLVVVNNGFSRIKSLAMVWHDLTDHGRMSPSGPVRLLMFRVDDDHSNNSSPGSAENLLTCRVALENTPMRRSRRNFEGVIYWLIGTCRALYPTILERWQCCLET